VSESTGSAGLSPRFDHIGLAVRDAAAAAHLFIDVLGGQFILGGDNHDTDNRVVQIGLGGSKVELLQPLTERSALHGFLRKRGEGFHHATFVVEDLERAIETCVEASFPVTQTDLANPTWRETFLSPRVTGGPLLQLVSTDRSWTDPVDGVDLRGVLAGAVEFQQAWPVPRGDLEVEK